MKLGGIMTKNKKSKLLKKLKKSMDSYNNLCPYIYECREPFCVDKFGRYKTCLRYKSETPRTNTNDYLQYKDTFD